jgi:hypothetical protein
MKKKEDKNSLSLMVLSVIVLIVLMMTGCGTGGGGNGGTPTPEPTMPPDPVGACNAVPVCGSCLSTAVGGQTPANAEKCARQIQDTPVATPLPGGAN